MYHAAAVAPIMPTRSTLEAIPDGPAGTRETLKRMRDAVLQYKTAPAVRAQAVAIAQPVRSKDWAGEARAVQRWVQTNIRYVRDVRGVETLQAPDYTLQVRAGDCDDHSMLVAALLESIGHPTQLVAGGRLPGRYVHVWAETLVGRKWVPVETTQPYAFGQRPPLPFRLVQNIR